MKHHGHSMADRFKALVAYDPLAGLHHKKRRRDGGRVNSLSEADALTDRNPTKAQKVAGNYSKGKFQLHGMEISIENPRGSMRTGMGPDGKEWRVRMPVSYGYIKRTIGADDDQVDAFVGPHHKSPHVFVIDQHDLHSGNHDEHKVMLGFGSKKQAADTYHRAFSDGRGKERIGHIEAMTVPDFKHWLAHADTTKAIKSHRKGYADGGGVDDLSDDDRAAMSPETFANPAVKSAIGSLATLPQRVIENSQYSLGSGTYDPGPTLEAATLPMGTGAIAGVPVRAGEAVLGAGPIRAYHGSPHDFDAFDMSKIGTGEGAQAYGHGLYFAENPKVAEGYRNDPKMMSWTKGKDWTDDQEEAFNWLHENGYDQKAASDAIAKRIGQARMYADSPESTASLNGIKDIIDSGWAPPRGKMYDVNIHADPEHFLDWDKPVSEQSQHVREALSRLDSSLPLQTPPITNIKDPEVRSIVRRALKQNEGEVRDLHLTIDNDSALYDAATKHAKRNGVDIDALDMRPSDYVYQQAKPYLDSLHNSQITSGDALGRILGVKGADAMDAGTAAAKIHAAGIPGIKYLDAGSRAGGEGSRNYVVFDHRLVKVNRKYAQGGRVADERARAEHALPPNHQLGMRVPKGGSMCARCEFLSSPTTCGNKGFVEWNGGAKLPDPADEYCCDLYEIAKPERADGGSVHMAGGGVPDFDPSVPAAPVTAAAPDFDPSVPATPIPSGLQSAVRGLGKGLSFGFSDELRGIDEAGGAKPGEPGTPINTAVGAYKYWTGDPDAEKTYNEAVTRERAKDVSYHDAHPYLSMAGEIAGSIPTMAALPEVKIAQGATGAMKLASKIAEGAITGGEYGAVSGAGDGTDETSRATGAATGAGAGIVGGGIAGGASSLLSDAVAPLVGAFKAWKDPEAEASKRLTKALQADQDLIQSGKAQGMSPQEWIDARQRGEPVTLADLGGTNTQALLRSAANTSPEGRAVLENTFNERFSGQSERVADEVRGLVAGGANANKTADQLVAEYDKARVPAYKQSFREGDREITSPAIERLMGSPTFEQAMKNAVTSGKDRAVTDGYGAFNPGVTVENGMIKFTKTKPNGVPQYPNLQYWDAVKKELDSTANVARRAGDNGRAEVAGNLATTLRNELDAQVPSYGNARGIAAQYFGENNALEAGRKLAGKRVDPQQITDVMRKMKPDERDLFREGYASDWANRVISNISDTRDITKAMFNSPNERARALAVFGPAGMDKMQARMSLETIMDGARKAMGNSTTARQLIEAGLAGGITGYETGWNPLEMAGAAGLTLGAHKGLGMALSTGAQKLIGKVDGRTAKLVAKLLTSDDPRKLQQGLRMAQKNPTIKDGLMRMASKIGVASQNPVRPYTGPNLGPLQGPTPASADQKQQ